MSATGEWQQIGVVYRSPIHGQTWVGVLEDTDQYSTYAGPLAVVKRAVREVLEADGDTCRFRKDGPNGWLVEINRP